MALIFNNGLVAKEITLSYNGDKQLLKDIKPLMDKYGIKFEREQYSRVYTFVDYNVRHLPSNDKKAVFANLEKFVTELKEQFPIFDIKETSKFHYDYFGNKYDNEFTSIDKINDKYVYTKAYISIYTLYNRSAMKGVDLESALPYLQEYYDNKGKDYKVLFKTNGKHNFQSENEPAFDALVVVGGLKRLIDQLYVYDTCLYDIEKNELVFRGQVSYELRIPYTGEPMYSNEYKNLPYELYKNPF